MTPGTGRSRIVRHWSTTSSRKRWMRNGRLSSEKLFDAATMIWTRLATCAANAPTKPRKSSQNASVWITAFERARGGGSCLDGLDDRRNDLEEIADDAVVGHFEDGRVGILVDRDDGAGALHADEVLDRAGDAEREIKLGRDGLPRAADLTLHRQPAGVAYRARCRDLGADRAGELLGHVDVRLLLDPAADGHDPLGLREIDGLLRLLERRLGLLA